MQFERDRVLAFVKRSPARKGESVHDGDDELGRFYDVFVAPNEIVFEVHRDVVLGPLVARDVTT